MEAAEALSGEAQVLADKDLLSIQQARQAAVEAHQAEQSLKNFSQERIDAIVEAMAKAAEKASARLAEMAVEETGYGNVRDKTLKNLFSSVDFLEYSKGLKTCGVIREDESAGVIEIAAPVGVVAAVIPTTNPTSTAIFKILCALKGRNTIVLAPHPRAVGCTIETARLMYEEGLRQGLPKGSVGWIREVTLEGTSELMKHRRTSIILATGGPGLVRAAYSSGKPAYGVGPGNVPAYVDRSADVAKAARDIVAGKSFDWGVLCSSEQAVVCDRPVEARLLEELARSGGYLMSEEESVQICRLLTQGPGGSLNRDIVGQSPQKIARMAGFEVPEDRRCLIGRAQGVGRDHPLSMEKLSPVLAFYVEDGWESGCRRCIEILNYGGKGHTLAIHCNDRDIVMQFGLQKPAYRICVNTPAAIGAVGLTTGLAPSMTLGCGSPGGNVTSDNINPMHLVNIKRVAFETRPVDRIDYSASAAPSPEPSPTGQPSSQAVALENVRQVVRGVVEEFLREKKKPTALNAPDPPPPSLDETPVEKPPAAVKPVDFVCEDDVRRALRDNARIAVDAKTIITPAARDLGEPGGVFEWA